MTEVPQLIHAAVLGLMQGLAEFLPISSSAHLVIIPEILGWPYLGKAFDVALHFGTLLALFVVFKDDVVILLRGTKNLFMRSPDAKPGESSLVLKLIVGCIPAGVIGLAFEDVIEEKLGGLLFVAAMLIGWGILLELADRKQNTEGGRTLEDLTFRDAIIIGCAQAVAILPGISRSGSTVGAALALGLSPLAAAEFSFLLGVIAIAGAGILVLPELTTVSGPLLQSIAIGGTSALLSGLVALWLFVWFLRAQRFYLFAWYAWLVGAATLTASLLA